MALRSVQLYIKLLVAFMFVFLLFVYVRSPPLSLDTRWSRLMWNGTVHNILDERFEPKRDSSSIFFVETSKTSDKVIRLNPRQSCSIESAALANPDHQVFVLFASEADFYNEELSPVINALLSYSNVHLTYSNINDFSKQSPLEAWFRQGTILKSDHLVEHESDILRILALWKYGGTYFDLDVVVRKPVSSIGSNFACIEDGGLINSAVLNLDTKLGKSIAEQNFKEVINHFDGHSWIGNGPSVLSNIVKKMCNTTKQSEMTRDRCKGFKVLPTEDCYAIHYPSWRLFFDEKQVKHVDEATKDSFAIHFWNKLSHDEKLLTNSSAPYIKIAEKYCPRVLQASGDNF